MLEELVLDWWNAQKEMDQAKVLAASGETIDFKQLKKTIEQKINDLFNFVDRKQEKVDSISRLSTIKGRKQ